MPHKHLSHLALFLLIVLLLAACAPVQPSAPTPVPPTAPVPTAAPVAPTVPAPTATVTAAPAAATATKVAPAPTAVPMTPAPQPVVRRIEFAPGTSRASVQGRVPVGGVDAWVLKANAGQQLSLRLTPKSGKAILVVYGADGTVLQSDHVEAAAFEGVLPITQDYNLHVVNRGDVGVEYTLEVSIPPMAQPTSVAQPTPVARRIQFAAGATAQTVSGQVASGTSDAWVLGAGAGQTLSVRLMVVSGQAGLIIFGADGTVLLSEGAGASDWTGPLPKTQDYTIRVRNNGAGTLSYGLTVTVPPINPPAPVARRITFPAGGITATVRGQIAASGNDLWIVGAGVNQRMTANLAMSSGQAILIVWGADGTVLQTDHAGASTFDGQLPKTQDYNLSVRCVSADGCTYALTVTIPPAR